MKSNVQCYMCGKPATSKEHVPPKCMFPEKKDLPEIDLRKDLITVPSCDEHNLQKSKDDEFLMVSIAGIIGNNSIGYKHKLGKVDRAIRRSSYQLIEKAILKHRKYYLELDKNIFLEVIWGTPDFQRLENCIEHMTYAIFYHHYNTRFVGKTNVALGYLFEKDKNRSSFIRVLKHKANIELENRTKFGRNQGVFYYQFTDKDQYGLFLLKLCFYDGIDIFVSFQPHDVVIPENFTAKLIEMGIKTYVVIEDESYEFN